MLGAPVPAVQALFPNTPQHCKIPSNGDQRDLNPGAFGGPTAMKKLQIGKNICKFQASCCKTLQQRG